MSIDVLQAKIRKMKNPSMLGLAPTPELIPPQLLEEAFSAHGQTPQALAAAYSRFCRTLLDTLAPILPAVSLQSGCFSALGAPGVAVLQKLLRYAGKKGYYVLLDGAFGETGAAAALAAEAAFGGLCIGETQSSIYPCDAVTVNGYAGTDAAAPFLPYCKSGGKSLFLLVKTPNKSGREVQELLSGDRVIYTAMADLARRWGEDKAGRFGYTQVGAVVSAAQPQILARLRQSYDRLFLLIPDYGTQGVAVKNVQFAFDRLGYGAVVCASQSILGAWRKQETDGADYAALALQAAEKMKKDIAKYVVVM